MREQGWGMGMVSNVGALLRAPPCNVVQVQIQASTPFMGSVCCWSLLLVLAPRGFSPGDLVFPSPQIQHFQIPVDLERTVGKEIGDA